MFAKSHFSGSPSPNMDIVRDLCEKLYQISENKEKVITHEEIKNLYFFPSKRWDLELRDNTLIKLPNDNINLALNLAIEFLNDHKFIDARIKNQIILND